MSEMTLQIISSCKIAFVSVIALLYGLGGMSSKWRRRYLASLLIVVGFCGFSLLQGTFSYYYLICYPLLIAVFSMGYGVNSKLNNLFGNKILVRLVQGIAFSCATLPVFIINDQWMLFGLHLGVMSAISVVLGVFNPLMAREEESLFGTFVGLLPLFAV